MFLIGTLMEGREIAAWHASSSCRKELLKEPQQSQIWEENLCADEGDGLCPNMQRGLPADLHTFSEIPYGLKNTSHHI